MMGRRRRGCLAVLVLLLTGLAGLGGCASVGAELRPGQRAAAEGFVASLHDAGGGQYQVVVRHPPARSRSPGPVVARLEGESSQPVTSTVGRSEVRGSGTDVEWSIDRDGATAELVPERVVEERREVVLSTWSFDRARWVAGRPFRLTIGPAFGPPGDGVTLELRLGGEPGSSAGLELRALPPGG